MSYVEYEDLYKKAQNKKTDFVIYTLDIKESQKCNIKDKEKSIKLMFKVAKVFECLELKFNKKFLVKNEYITHAKEYKDYKLKNQFLCYYNPNFSSGDFISFYFYSENINKELFFKVVQKIIKNQNNNLTYHFASLNYETNDYVKANTKYWVGYAQQKLINEKNLRSFDLNKNQIIDLKNKNLIL